MKVIFLEDVNKVARAGQTKDVANGYARNFLFPRRLAVLADSSAAATVEAHLKKVLKQRAIEEAEMAEFAKLLAGVEVTIRAKVGENEKLYGSVTGADIAEALSKKVGREVDKKKVDLAEPIRQTGSYDVTIRFTHEITAAVKVHVISEDAVEGEVPKAEVKAEVKAEKAEEKKEKAEKKEKKAKAEVTTTEAEAVKEEKAEKKEKPAKKEKKAKAEAVATEAVKEEKPEAEKKEKKAKPKAEKKAKKSAAKPEEEAAKES